MFLRENSSTTRKIPERLHWNAVQYIKLNSEKRAENVHVELLNAGAQVKAPTKYFTSFTVS